MEGKGESYGKKEGQALPDPRTGHAEDVSPELCAGAETLGCPAVSEIAQGRVLIFVGCIFGLGSVGKSSPASLSSGLGMALEASCNHPKELHKRQGRESALGWQNPSRCEQGKR